MIDIAMWIKITSWMKMNTDEKSGAWSMDLTMVDLVKAHGAIGIFIFHDMAHR